MAKIDYSKTYKKMFSPENLKKAGKEGAKFVGKSAATLGTLGGKTLEELTMIPAIPGVSPEMPLIPRTESFVGLGKTIYDKTKPNQSFSDAAMGAIKSKTGGGVSIGQNQILPPARKKTLTSQSTISPFPLTSATNNIYQPNRMIPGGLVTAGSVPTPLITAQEQITIPKKQEGVTTKVGTSTISTTGTTTDDTQKQAATTQTPTDLNNQQKYLRNIYLGNKPADMTDERWNTLTPEEKEGLKRWALQTGSGYGVDVSQPTLDELRQSAVSAREAFIESGLQGQLTGIDAQRQRALGTLEQQRAGIAPQYEALRTQAATRAMQQARNFAEYMGARGALMGGAAAQAEIQRGAELQGRFGEIGLAEQQAIQDLENKKRDVSLQFDTEISQAKSAAEQAKQQEKLNQQLSEIERIEKEMIQKIENARKIEEQKINTAAETAKDEEDFRQKKELITFQTNESIRAAREKANIVSNKPTSNVSQKESSVKLVGIKSLLKNEIFKTPETLQNFLDLNEITTAGELAQAISDSYGDLLTSRDLSELLDFINEQSFLPESF